MPTCYTPADKRLSDAVMATSAATIAAKPFAVYTADAGVFTRYATLGRAYAFARLTADRLGVDVRIADDKGLTAIVVAR